MALGSVVIYPPTQYDHSTRPLEPSLQPMAYALSSMPRVDGLWRWEHWHRTIGDLPIAAVVYTPTRLPFYSLWPAVL